jgi:hypothetical protein
MRTPYLKSALVAASLLTSAAHANLQAVDITINFNGGMTASQQSVFTAAEAFWENTLGTYAVPVAFPTGITIEATGSNIDGSGGVLGSAGPTNVYYSQSNNIYYTATGDMNFDTADLSAMENNNTLYDVILHEMAHVIGFGTLFEMNNLYTPGTGQYTGSQAVAAYQSEFDAAATYVPIELDGGAGTADGHWDETWAGPQSDLMTGYIEGVTTFSETTLASFRDLGYSAPSSAQSGEPSNVSSPLIAGFGLFMLVLGLRRKV